jgi:hypothetical protein
MPETEETTTPKAPAKPKAKPIVKAKAAKNTPKAEAKKPVANAPVAEMKEKKTRSYTRKPKGLFADLLKKQAELEKAKNGAKVDLKKQYESLLKESEQIKAHYKELFNESIESEPKVRGAGTKRASSRGYTLEQVKLFIEQAENGGTIKIPGKNATGIKKIKAAYMKAKNKDAESVLALLNK